MSDAARQVEHLIYAYAERIDAGDFDGVAALFRHGRIQTTPTSASEGVDQVRSLYAGVVQLHDDGTPRTRHVTTNVVVEVDDEVGTASARSYYTVLQQTDALPLQPIIAGHYHDTFHQVDGRWWFDTREIFVDLTGDLSHHLLIDL